jgi:glycosyltransferase involved in cell wall biosynthesis
MNLLIIGHNIPEPTTTAAGGRMLQLIELFLDANYNITFASTAKATEHSLPLKSIGIPLELITLNDPAFDEFVRKLNPELVLFDRYISEEQFGWRVAEQCPKALTILDTEDLHFLRKARQEAVKKDSPATKANLYTDTAKRELASILRCDLSIIISEAEMELLQTSFQIPKGILHYLPFLTEAISEEEKKHQTNFDTRRHFMTIGNYLHPPNVDSVLFLKQKIWSGLRKHLPTVELHIYGAYASQQLQELHSPKEGFFIKGWAPAVDKVMQQYRLCLAPLQFGAGLKGKLFDAMRNGTPAVTTPIGAEGMYGEFPVPGAVEENVDAFIKATIRLYSEEEQWTAARDNGFDILQRRFKTADFAPQFLERIKKLQQNLTNHRKQYFIGRILQHQTLQATKYMSKWIEEKNRKK